ARPKTSPPRISGRSRLGGDSRNRGTQPNHPVLREEHGNAGQRCGELALLPAAIQQGPFRKSACLRGNAAETAPSRQRPKTDAADREECEGTARLGDGDRARTLRRRTGLVRHLSLIDLV